MPASDQTWYNLKRLHKAFAVSSVLLLLATLLLFAVDHRREWKKIQRTSDRVEVRFAEWRRMQQLTEDMQAEQQRLSEALSEVQAGALSSDVLREFREEIVADAARRGAEPTDFAEFESRLQNLGPAVEAVQKATRRWQESRLAADKAALEAEDAEKKVAEGNEAASLRQAVEVANRRAVKAGQVVELAEQEKETAQATAAPLRESVLDWLRDTIRAARFREDEALRQRKFASADLDAAKGERDITLRKEASEPQIERLSDAIQQKQEAVSKATLAYEVAAAHRQSLQLLLGRLTNEEAAIQERLAENQKELRRLDQLLGEKKSTYFTFNGFVPLPGKRWLELPVLDAFNSPRKINNVWSDDLDRKLGSFGRVHRFDRCTTCHQAIDKVDPSDPTRQAFLSTQTIDLVIPWPERPPEAWSLAVARELSIDQQLDVLLGIQFADEGLLNPSDVTVRFVRPASLAAEATSSLPEDSLKLGGLLRDQWLQTASTSIESTPTSPGVLVGDVITAINGVAIDDEGNGPGPVTQQLLSAATAHWQTSEDGAETVPVLHLTVRRGLPSPYHSHPRLDLYLGSFSPHKLSEFGCTVCHEGQGSATAFKWSSHTPNDEATRQRWREEFGWFDNPHWAFPMNPKRFVESACLKCHHDVTELKVSDRFTEPAAPQVVRGYKLIRKNGCFGCHEINGYDGTEKRVGPDMRVEPNYAAVAAQFRDARGTGYEKLTAEEKKWVEQLIAGPERADVRHKLYSMLVDDARLAARSRDAIPAEMDEEAGAENDSTPRFSRYVHRELAPLLKDQKNPGTLRKVGPSLRHVGHKLDDRSLVQWVARPSSFRPSTSMPQFFGLWRHLPDPSGQDSESNNSAARPEQDLERVEVVSMVQFLLQYTQPFTYELPPEGVAAVATEEEEQEQIERGKIAFEERGCLACHSHVDFPEMEAYRERDVLLHGPDLSDLSAKLGVASNPNGPKWLYSWITNPMGYHPRTRMPNSDLAPISHRDESGTVVKVTDPADDITAYLLSVAAPDAQTDVNPSGTLSPAENLALTRLAKEYLRDAVFEKTADRFVEQGIPAERRSEFKDAELELVVREEEDGRLTEEALLRKRLLYVGRKSIAKHGCYACHDIPGFEAAKPIGPELSEWGRVDPHKLAFEHVVQYVTPDTEEPRGSSRQLSQSKATSTQQDQPDSARQVPEYYRHQLESNSRIGFIYQKVSEPRSYDYRKTEVKRYNERLRMPQFRFDDTQRESIITFVLGLVADPPRSKYVYRPDERSKKLIEGWELLDKYNCGGCHILDAEKWELAFEPDDFGRQIASPSYPFLTARFGEDQVASSRVMDRRGLRSATIEGMPSISDDGKPEILEDGEFPLEEEEEEEFDTSSLTYRFQLWKPAVLDGHVYQVGEVPLLIAKAQIERRQATVGGDLAKYLLPRVVRREQEENPDAKGREAWGWLPPPLVGEGQRVQPEWLHNYLIDPYVIRPAVALKMPLFNLSSREAQVLADYFAVKDNAPFPYEFDRQQQAKHLADADARYADVLAKLGDIGGEGQDKSFTGRHLYDAMKIVTDANYCIKCHIVGDFDPVATDLAKAPDLSLVHRRLRSGYVRRWVARPSSVLPYTNMPINIPYAADEDFLGTTVPQDLYHGTSLEQLEALVDLLMNYDQYARQRSPISPLVRQQNTEDSGQVEPSPRPNP